MILVRPIVVLLALIPALAGARADDLPALRSEALNLQRDSGNLDTAIERQAAENGRILESLDVVTNPADVTFEALRQAQFELEIAATRQLTLEHRIAEAEVRLAALNADLVRDTAALGAEDETLARVFDEAALEWRGRTRDAFAGILDKMRRYRELSAEYVDLRQEQLAILQRVIPLSALEGRTPAEDTPVALRLRKLVERLAQDALADTNAASAIVETTPEATERRNLLRLRADEALLRSAARLTDVAIIEARGVLDGLAPMPNEPAIPIRLFDDAIAALSAIDADLAQRLSNLVANRSALSDFRRLLIGEAHDAIADDLAVRIANLDALFTTQDGEIRALRDRLDSTLEALSRERIARDRATLFTRDRARTDAAARARIGRELSNIPAELRTLYAGRLTEVTTALRVAARQQLASFVVAAVVLFASTLYLRGRLLKRFVRSGATKATEAPLEIVRRNLYWLLPVALWWLFAQVFAISRETAISIMVLLAIPAAAALLRDATQVLVSRPSAGNQRRRLATLITRATEVAGVLSTGFVFLYALLGEIPLLPSTQIAIHRLVYSVLVLSGLPMLLFVFVFARAHSSGYGPLRRWGAGLLSLLPPTALIATGITGLAGYTNLAAVMLENLGFATAIGAGLWLALSIFNDVIEVIATRVRRRHPDRAFFVRANFLRPLLRAGQLGILVGAIAVAVRVFGWTTDTPGIATAVVLWRDRVFSIGGAAYSVGDVVFSALAFAFVFWLAGWSRRVAYTVVFGGLKDIGIRQSLSVFSQYMVIVVGVLLTLSAVGFDVTTLTVFAASLGVGIGLGLQNIVNNFISGLLLLVERPLRVGDIVTVGANSGTVQQIGIRSMRMRTFDEFDLIVPNSSLISETFTNWTRTNSVMRVVIMIGIGYDCDPAAAVRICEQIIDAHPGVLRTPEREVTVEDFADSAVMIRICYYIDLRGTLSGFAIRSDVLMRIRSRFAAEGITIPFPQRDVRIVTSAVADPRGAFVAAAVAEPGDDASAARETADA